MGRRKDQPSWTPEQDAFIRERFEMGLPTRVIHAQWPKGFPYRTITAITLRKQKLGIKTALNPDLTQRGVKQPPPPEEVGTWAVQDEGDEIVVRSFGTEVKTLEELIARAKIDTTKYEIDKPETSMHETTVRDAEGKIRKVQNFRLVARFRLRQGPTTKEMVESIIAGAFAPRKPTMGKVPKVAESDFMQASIIADPHIGKLAWPAETGREAWDTAIAVDTVRDGVRATMAEGNRRGVAERRFVLLGDFLHHDGKGMTTSGTVMDYDSRVQKMLRAGTEVLFDLIEESARTVPTHVYVVPGNHDRILTWALQLVLQTEFKRHGGVIVDDTYTSTKFMQWGRCLVGMDHGDKGKTRLPAHMAAQCESEWGNSICREILTGHLHSRAAIQTVNGIVVRTMDALCPPDLYHAEEKFTSASPRTIEAITYHRGGIPAHTDVWSPDLNRAPRSGLTMRGAA